MTALFATTLEESLPDKDQVAEATTRLGHAGVKYVFACWVDLLGIPKAKPIPLEQFGKLCRGKGPQFAVHSVSMVPELGPADADQTIVPDLASLVVCPWDTQCAWVFADLFFEGHPYDVCPRQALRRQLHRAFEQGYRFNTGIEPEFIVMRYGAGPTPSKAFDDDLAPGRQFRPKRQPYGYDAEFALDAMPFIGQLTDMLDGLGWGIDNVVCEGAYSQFELDFGYSDPLTMADRFTFLRILLKQVAKTHGYFVTFMPKPTQGDWRNGAHINHSFEAVDHPGVNLLEGTNGEWGERTYPTLGGLINHGAAIAAVTCPTVNSYKGLVGRVGGLEGGTVTWAPTHMCYGHNNRSAMLRLPLTRKAIENRACDMSMNAYLGLAMTVGATLDGLRKGLDPGRAIDQSLYDFTPTDLNASGIRPLPQNLREAIRAFDEDDLAKEVLGATMHKSYSRYKHDEWHRFHEQVTEWEQAEYLRFF